MDSTSIWASRLALHPQRKRKVFTDLAQLLNEDAPPIRPLQGAFFGPQKATSAALPSPAQTTSFVSSHSLTSDTIESVDFDAPRTRTSAVISFGASQQSSYNESMADSLFFLPMGNSSLNSSGGGGGGNRQKRQDKQHVRFEFELGTNHSNADKHAPVPVTTPANLGMMPEKPLSSVRLELADYYDNDRMCELSPCWLRSDRTSCELHQGAIRRLMLLFCLQVMNEFIARNEWQGQQRWRVQSCKIARRVFTAMWEADVLGVAPLEGDVVVADYVTKRTALVGVTLDVWRIIARYWDNYKQN